VNPLPGPGTSALGPDASHHLLGVLRAPIGTAVALFDGHGHEARGRLVGTADGVAVVEVGPVERRAPDGQLRLVLAVLKGNAMTDAIRMATEAGATEIHPVLAARSIARGERIDRWIRVAEAACQQCGRADLPSIAEIVPFRAGLEAVPRDWDRRIAHPGGHPLGPTDGDAAVVVGPEGGFTPDEIALASELGFVRTSLARHVLRADTAAADAVALTAHR
jgi:16S rRNA (uracil1498-N3)-methyltransferase